MDFIRKFLYVFFINKSVIIKYSVVYLAYSPVPFFGVSPTVTQFTISNLATLNPKSQIYSKMRSSAKC